VSQLLAPKAPKKFPDEERELLTRREINKLSSEAEKVEEENKRRDYTRLRKVEILQEEAHPSQVPIVGANMELSPSFDHEVNQHRYNATDFVYGWSVRPIMSSQDNIYEHDDGIEMFQVARDGVVRKPGKCVDGLPASMIVQAGKGKNFGNIQMDAGCSWYTTRNMVGSANIIVHPAGQDGEVVYTPTVDLRAKVGDKYKTTVGGMACRLAENGWPNKGQLGLGAKLENKVKVKDGVKLTTSGGAMTVKPSSSQARDVAYGANVELKLAGGKGEYDPNLLFSGGVSHQKRGAFKRTGFSGQISGEQAISPETMINARLQLSAGGSGTSSLRMITHDKPQTGWLMAVPIVIKAVKRLLGHGDEFV